MLPTKADAPPKRSRRDGSKRLRHILRDSSPSEGHRRGLTVLAAVEDGVHYAVAVLLLFTGGAMLVYAVEEFFTTGAPFAERTTAAINSILFVVIVMEILRTVVAHFEDAGLQLKPFLIIGIISAVRHILTVGAKVSLETHSTASEFRKTQIELGVNAAVVIALVIGLILVRRTEQVE